MIGVGHIKAVLLDDFLSINELKWKKHCNPWMNLKSIFLQLKEGRMSIQILKYRWFGLLEELSTLVPL